jgi:hypothetical protein
MQVTNSILQKHIKNGKVAPSYLLIDKDILKVREIAQWFTSACKFLSADVFWLVPEDDAETIQVKGTEAFIEKANFAAVGARKLLVVCDISAMTVAAQNKLLKTVEEAVSNTHFLLLASNGETVLNTIKSRCVIIYPCPLTAEQVRSVYPSMSAEFCNGTFSGAARFAGNPDAPSIYRSAKKLLTEVQTLDEALPLLPLLVAKDNFHLSLAALDFYLGKLLHLPDRGRWTVPRVNAIIKQLAIINRNAAANCNPQNAFDLLLIKLFEETL